MNKNDLISREAAIKIAESYGLKNGSALGRHSGIADCIAEHISTIPSVYAVEVSEIKAYLQDKLNKWNALGDRKFEPANMWGYNFIMACFDDLERMDGE